ncbi:3-hydroxyacyl-CoA dehydrogenase [Nocardioides marmoriginsengisoli]|uniref:3-hydroxyacyl-CoA dehydrogenase n=1 Tax=Nocardioides marmoriginsengisoli TaxID=661483 RepID=A0A3N0CI79_9ACTN|nr:3-hydroxyacyl-CoA dehydrogenase [Nocardioides marmoriginsengisoli]RNL62726.1 3-hydroxyacyl-CoA dehydrogenase [Nocardioides marmoriginsengisoli]
MSSLHNLTVLGAGVLGGQIAWQSAFKGKRVTVYDISDEAIERCRAAHDQYAAIYLADVGATDAEIDATRARLSFTTELASAVSAADLVIEAVPEIPDIKTATYQQMAPLLPAHTIVATNSSTLLPSDFAAASGRPDRFASLHFGNGIWAMNFAELMVHAGTSRETVTALAEFSTEIGMVPIPLLKEQSGYVVNTWFVPLLNAAQTLVTNGIARPEDVDRTFMIGGPAVGPLGMMDMVGMKTAYDVLAHWGRENDDVQMTANAAYIKERFLDKGDLGVPTGKGYYDYPSPAYAEPGFLAIPDPSAVPGLVALIAAD